MEVDDHYEEWWPHWEPVPIQPNLLNRCTSISVEALCYLIGLWFLAGSQFCRLASWALMGRGHGNLQRWVLVGLECAFFCASIVLFYILVGLVTTHISAVASAILANFPSQTTFLRVEVHVEFTCFSLVCAIWQSSSILVASFAISLVYIILVALSWAQLIAFLLICGIVMSGLKGDGM